MKPWREIATPHRDVLEGTMLQAAFAVDLHAVRLGRAPASYQDPRAFFDRTFITAGMKQLLTEVVRRLAGQGGEPVVQLQTGFGGGKTHTLLAVYHLATRSAALRELAGLSRVLDDAGVVDVPHARVAVLDGTDLAPGQPWKSSGIQVRTLWGELAVQLLGAEGYALVAEADRTGTSPGKDALRTLFEMAGPCVILVDELVAYVRQFSGEAALSGGTFASNLSFIQALTEAVKTVPHAMLLASLPESELEVGGLRGVETLRALEKIFGRVQALWKPVATEEAFEIVRMRLFEPIANTAARREVCQAFAEAYRAEGVRVPAETHEARYAERLEIAYPIHPEIFDRLFEDWSTLDGFQRTRGVLKLMARVIHRLWRDGNTDAMILPASLPLHDREAYGELTSYLPQGWEAVIERDIDGGKSESAELDTKDARFGPLRAATRVSRVIFLGSAPSSGSARPGLRGVDKARIMLGCLQPGQTSAVYADALAKLGDRLHYLNTNGESSGTASVTTRYWFDTRANLRREMEERRGRFRDTHEVKAELETVVKKLLGRPFEYVHIFASHGDVPDDEELRLVVLAPTERYEKPAAETRPKKGRAAAETDLDRASSAALEMLQWNGSKPRARGNRLLFLAADHVAYERLSGSVKALLAWQSIVDDIEAGRLNVDRHQEKSARSQAETARGVAEQTARECFKWLLAPLQEDPADAPHMEAFPLKTSGTPLRDEVLRVCREQELVIDTWAAIHLRGVLATYYWKADRAHAGARQVWDDTTKYLYLPRLRNFQAFEQVVRAGAASEDFFATAQGHDGTRYEGLALGRTLTQVDRATLLVKPDAAREQLTREAAPPPPAAEEPPAEAYASDGHGPREPNAAVPTTTTPKAAKAASQPKLRVADEPKITHFFASKDLPAQSAKFSFSELFTALVQPLIAVSSANIRVSVNIDAELPDGMKEELRAALEKAAAENGVNTLGFE